MKRCFRMFVLNIIHSIMLASFISAATAMLGRRKRSEDVLLAAVRTSKGDASMIMLQRHVLHVFGQLLDLCLHTLNNLASGLKNRDVVSVCKYQRTLRTHIREIKNSISGEKDCLEMTRNLARHDDARIVKESHGYSEFMIDRLERMAEVVRQFISDVDTCLSIDYECELMSLFDDVKKIICGLSQCIPKGDFEDSDYLDKLWLECEFVDYVYNRQLAQQSRESVAKIDDNNFYCDILQSLSGFMKAVKQNVKMMAYLKNNIITHSEK